MLQHSRTILQRYYPLSYRQSSIRSITIPSVARSWIGSAYVSTSNETDVFDNLAPNSGEILCRVEPPTQENIESAIRHARAAATEWAAVPAWDRGIALRELANRVKANEAALCELEAMDTGLPISQIKSNHIPFAISTLEYFASLVQTGLEGRIVDTPHAGGHADSFAYTRREPLGVCLGIGAWNYPFMTMMWKVAPALACGNSMIYKPSECTPLSALTMAKLCEDVLPPALLQVLPGEASVARALLASPDIDKVSVTGSVATGRNVAKRAAESLKRVTLELGGKSPLLIFADADMESAVRIAVDGNFINNGQVCSNATRVFVEKSCLDEFVKRLLIHLEGSVVVGDNMDTATTLSPLMMHPRDPGQYFENVCGFIERAHEDDRIVCLTTGKCYQQGGFIIEPHVFLSNSDDTEIAREEIFGPVMTLLPFDTEQEAVSRANSTDFGLAAGVMTQNVTRAHRVAKALQAGTVWINHWNLAPLEMPFGPCKKSGYGKELGVESLDSYSQTKSVYMEMDHVRDSTC